MLTPRNLRTLGGIGLALAVACGYPLARNLLTALPVSRVANCKVTFSHTYFVYVTLDSGRMLVLDELDVPDPAKCLPPGTTIEKSRGEFGFRLNGRAFFWASRQSRSYAMYMIVSLLVAVGTLILAAKSPDREK